MDARSLLAAALLSMSSASLHAQAPCDTVSTQTAMTRCAQQAAHRSAERLRSLLAELRTVLDSARFVSLGQVQGRWETYRDSHCTWEGNAFEGGSIAPMWISNCIASVTEARIQTLKIHLCEGAGMTGECAASHRYDLPKRGPE